MKRILIPTDFSPCSKSALQVGAAIAKASGAEIMLLHILYSPLGLEKLPPKMAEYPEIKEAVSKTKKALKKEEENPALKGLKIETKIDIGTPARDILFYSKSWKADLIIMGTHGMDDKAHPFVGSTAQKVLRGADCPVLSVQENHVLRDLKQMIFASNFDDGSSKPFEKILPVAQALKSTVHLLHINTPITFKNTRTINAQMDIFEKSFPKVKFTRSLYADYDVHTGVANFLQEAKHGIVALATRTRFKQPSYTLGITESVAYHSPIPVLSVNLK